MKFFCSSQRVVLLGLIAVCAQVQAGEIYRYVDEQGRVHYTDEPPAQYESKAEQMQVDGVQTYDGSRSSSSRVPAAPSRERGPIRYQSVVITRPSAGETIRDSSNAITVSVQTEPALSTRMGHRLRYFLDGQPVGEPVTTRSRTLTEVYRGSHTVQVVVIDQSGQQLGQSPVVTVYMKPPTVSR